MSGQPKPPNESDWRPPAPGGTRDAGSIPVTWKYSEPEIAADIFKQAIEEAEKYDSCMSLDVSNEGKSVELLLDTNTNYYLDWIPGEGGDIGLLRDRETKRVVGVHLPLLKNNLCVHHDGPIRINAGFRKTDRP